MLLKGNCLDLLATLADNSVDSIVTDPPYELGFMGKSWDSSGIAYNVGLWQECLRVLKPGGHLLAFSGSRTYHRMTVAIEDAGFEIRDQIMWVYGSGFPKSLDVSKAIDKAAGAERARKPVQKFVSQSQSLNPSGYNAPGWAPQVDAPATPEAQRWQGWGTALKPAHEPICVARKPFAITVAQNVLEWGTGALNIDGSRVGEHNGFVASTQGRWPANFIHDGLPEDWARYFYCAKASKAERNAGLEGLPVKSGGETTDLQDDSEGLRSPRAGAGRTGGSQNFHPTVKPLALMRYLVKLVTPPNGTVLDPFLGSGSTAVAAELEGFEWIGCEMTEDYWAIIEARVEWAKKQA